ncbi:MAG: CvpA family protein, partial [Flavobacteriales bacterium]
MPSYIDLFLLIPFGLAAWRGWKNGLVMEIFYLLALFAGLYGGFYLSDYAAQILHDKAGMTSENMPIISFVVVFAIILVGLYFLGKLITQTVSAGGAEKWNRFGGALFSLTKAALFISVIFLFVDS